MTEIEKRQQIKCTTKDGVELCKLLHEKLAPMGFFPALTGGLLYKEGERKDIDIVLFRHRQKHEHFETKDLFEDLISIEVYCTGFYGFVTKAIWKGFVVDLFNPESKKTDLEYGEETSQ